MAFLVGNNLRSRLHISEGRQDVLPVTFPTGRQQGGVFLVGREGYRLDSITIIRTRISHLQSSHGCDPLSLADLFFWRRGVLSPRNLNCFRRSASVSRHSESRSNDVAALTNLGHIIPFSSWPRIHHCLPWHPLHLFLPIIRRASAIL